MNPARKRFLVGVLLLLATFFYAFAPGCGLLGRFVHFCSSHLLGQTGSMLLALAMLVTGTLLVVPHDALGRLFRWALHGREARVATVVRDSDEWVRASEVRRLVAEAIKAREQVPSAPEHTVVERRKLDDVRSCLKQLQYRVNEYEPVVQAIIDLNVPVEKLVQNAIKTLHASKRAPARTN